MNWLEFLEKDCPVVPDILQKDRISRDVAGWMGFTYRQLQIETGMQSRDIAEIISAHDMLICYPGLHTVDEDMAAEILMHDFHLHLRDGRS